MPDSQYLQNCKGFIAAEDLKVRNLIKNRHLVKAIADAGWRKFLTMLQYKGDLYGKTVMLVPSQYTTQTCSVCGYVMQGKEHLMLCDRDGNVRAVIPLISVTRMQHRTSCNGD